jgi:hypothetical protein
MSHVRLTVEESPPVTVSVTDEQISVVCTMNLVRITVEEASQVAVSVIDEPVSVVLRASVINQGGGIDDGDKGDIVVSDSGATWSIDSGVLTTFGRSLVDDVNAAAARTTLELGTAAVEASGSFAAASHTHAIGDVTSLQAALDAKAASSHSHTIADVTNLQTTLDGKSATGHTHAQSDVTGLVTDLAGKQPLDSDLTTIAGLTATTDSFLQAKSSAWASRTVAQVKTDLGLTGTNAGDVTLTGTPDYITISGQVITRGAIDLAADVTGTLPHGNLGTGGGGAAKFLREDSSWQPVSASVSATTVEVDLGASLKFAGRFTITDAGIGPTSKILCWQAPGPYTGKGTRADEAQMQPVSVIAVEPGTGSAVVYWQTPPMVSTSNVLTRGNLGAGTLANSGTNRDLQMKARRLGMVHGNVKFTYTVLA